ncbi:MAG TPA: maleylpyruvate isomerase N-terminal domain-containing protein, partial [Actinomycetes bacterium]|nr:maleylpyruvate isomerase N-terminal domain-containing protein [Actinomycetes bacterium]
MAGLEHGRFCDEVVNQTDLLLGVLEGADLSATVPTAPDWALSDLLRHIGGNLRSGSVTGVPVRTACSTERR